MSETHEVIKNQHNPLWFGEKVHLLLNAGPHLKLFEFFLDLNFHERVRQTFLKKGTVGGIFFRGFEMILAQIVSNTKYPGRNL